MLYRIRKRAVDGVGYRKTAATRQRCFNIWPPFVSAYAGWFSHLRAARAKRSGDAGEINLCFSRNYRVTVVFYCWAVLLLVCV